VITFCITWVFSLLFPSLTLSLSEPTSFLGFSLLILSPSLVGGGVNKQLGGSSAVDQVQSTSSKSFRTEKEQEL